MSSTEPNKPTPSLVIDEVESDVEEENGKSDDDDCGSDSENDNECHEKEASSDFQFTSSKFTNSVPSIHQLCSQFNQVKVGFDSYKTPEILPHGHEDMSLKELIEAFEVVYNRWFGEEPRKLHKILLAHHVFQLGLDDYHTEEVIERVSSMLQGELTSLNIAFENLGVMDNDDPVVHKYQQQLNNMRELLFNSKQMLLACSRIDNARDPDRRNSSQEKDDLWRFHEFNISELDRAEKLTIYTLGLCAQRHFCKDINGSLYEERKIRCTDGKEYGTYSWRSDKSIREFIIEQCNPRINFDMWRCLMEKGVLDRVTKIITECQDPQLPDFKPDRTVSSWRNGIWFAEFAAFHKYTDGRLPGKICATVFIDQDFDTTDYGENFMDIPCVVKKILADQDFNQEDQSFILGVGLGRLIFEPGKYDRWEIIPFLWGLAQTGKSCIIDACSRLFDSKDVAGVGNSIEKQFGLSPLIGKNLWVANDVKKNFGMDAGDIQTITSLELMSVAIKNKTAVSIKWSVPGIIAGNEIPKSWTDTLRALERRIFLIDFPNTVKRDNSVKVRLDKERSLFYRIVTNAYHYWQRKCGDKNIWDYAPKRFREARKIIQEHENPLEMFLNSSEVEVTKDEKDYVREGYFNTFLKNWCSNWGQTRQKLSPTEIKNVLRTRGVKVKYCELKWPLNQTTPTTAAVTPNGSGADCETPLVPVQTALDHFYLGIRLVPKKSKEKNNPNTNNHASIGGNYSHHYNMSNNGGRR